MKKTRLIGILLLSTVLSSILFAGFAVAIDPYYPEPDAVEGYELLYESSVEVSNPLNASAPNVGAGAQIWTKTDAASDVTAVVGVAIIKFSEDFFGKRIPASMRTLLYLYTAYDNIKTYWDLIVAIATEDPLVNDISETITTTDGAIEISLAEGGYFILSKDDEFLIFSFGFEINNAWITYVVEHEEELASAIDGSLTVVASFLALFQSVILLMEGDLPIPETPPLPDSSSILGPNAPPTGDPTSALDVQFVTIQIGSLYGSSNLLWIILGAVGAVVVVIGIILLVRRRRR